MTGADLTHLALENAERIGIARGLTFAEVLEIAGISKQYIYMLRNGRRGERGITLGVLARLASVVRVAPSTLLLQRDDL